MTTQKGQRGALKALYASSAGEGQVTDSNDISANEEPGPPSDPEGGTGGTAAIGDDSKREHQSQSFNIPLELYQYLLAGRGNPLSRVR